MNEINKENHSDNKRQIVAAVGVSFAYFLCGNVNGWTASVLTKMSDDFIMGNTEYSLVVSMIALGAIIGCVMVGSVLDILGRKKTILSVTPILAIGWLTIAYANNIFIVYFGRFLTGFSTGFLFSGTLIYIGETCQANLRGKLSTLPPLFMSFGILATNYFGSYYTWRTSCFISIIPPIMLFLFMLNMPETPYWYLLKNERTKAEESMRWLRGANFDSSGELKEIIIKLESVKETVKYAELFKRRTRIPLLISLFVQTTQQISGGPILLMYTIKIFERSQSSVDLRLATVLTGIVQVIGSIISIFLIDRLGRRSLLTISVFGVGAMFFPLAYYFLVLEYGIGELLPTWLPVVLICSLIFSYCLGCRSIPWIISSELFNTKIRSKASSTCSLYNRLLHILIVQLFPYAASALGLASVFFFHGAMSIICGVITLVVVPETKGKSLEEIQEYFEQKAKKKDLNENGLKL